jgi:hypothetical protein
MSNVKPKKPAAAASKVHASNPYANALELDPALEKEILDQGLVPRWINKKKFEQDGFHKAGWRPYKRQKQAAPGSIEAVFGNGLDGYVIRKDSILAVLPEEQRQNLRAYIDDRTKRQEDPMKAAKERIRSSFQEAGMDSVEVTDKYESDDEED